MVQQLEQTKETGGLTDEQVRAARAAHGSNQLSRQKTKPFWRQFLSNLNDPVIRILLAALAVNLLLLFHSADWVETAGIGLAVFLATLISTLSERSSERAFARLSEEGNRATCRVRRAGGVREISISEVVMGDRVLLSAGECIPADGVLIRGGARVDQSAMTGESREIEKQAWTGPIAGADAHTLQPGSPYALFRGCNLTAGGGEMTVTAVGDATFLGQISREVQLEQRDSPLKLRLGKLAKQISILGYIAALLVVLSYLFHVFLLDSGMRPEVIRLKLTDLSYVFSSLFHAFTLGLTVIVVAVPEGLPMMIAVVLSANVRKMVRDQVLVRKPVGIEAAGSMDLLFTDKTGTLTEGKMSVVSLLFAGGEVFPSLPALRKRCGAGTADLLSLGLRGGGATPDAVGRPVGGSATERALLGFASADPQPSGSRLIASLPFDSARKYSAVTWSVGGRAVTVLLGAPEKLLCQVRGALAPNGGTEPRFSRSRVEAELRRMNAGGGRGLAVAVAEDVRADALADGIRGSFLLVGILELSDPVRQDAPGAVRDLHGAGVQVVMVTGDSRETAQAIAEKCGILCGTYNVILTADELAGMSDLRLKELLPRLAVVARALPTDKSRLVRLAQELGRVTGMTGDGINDAPALRRADVGFAMGGGTQVAKDAGDIVILDNRLSSIVRAVLYGRTVFKSIRKFITLQLTMNFSAVGVTMICPFLGIDSPVTVVQMLWINLIMDTLGGLAFAGEPPLDAYMREAPKRREESILNRYMVNEIVLLGGMTIAVCLLFLKHPLLTAQFRQTDGNLCLLTAFFALFIFSSVFNCFGARTDRLAVFAGLRKNPVFLGIMAAVLTIQLLFVYLGGSVLRTMPLTPRELGITLLVSLSVFPLELMRKLLWRLFHGRVGY